MEWRGNALAHLHRSLLLSTVIIGTVAAVPATADELVMFQQQGCPYCAAWDRQVGRIYVKTDEAKILPLRRVDIHATRPTELKQIHGVVFTPTFVVLHCGREFARITGYVGDEQFWGLLDEAVKAVTDAKAGAPCTK